jgi:hypothetical protein
VQQIHPLREHGKEIEKARHRLKKITLKIYLTKSICLDYTKYLSKLLQLKNKITQ